MTQAVLQGVSRRYRSRRAAENLDVATAVAKKVVPSVVSVTIQQAVVDFSREPGVIAEAGTGSGVLIRSDGHILTNNHVVEGADRIVVTVGLEDKVATVVGTDPSTDLAVLKIEGSGYPAAEAGSSKDLQVGQFVMAVGSPFGLEKTVTSGIISALQRSEQAQGQTPNDITTYTNLIQTDAAINPGNSGGALVDGQGRLVGINSLIQSPSGGVGAAQSAGIGFAIPVDFAIDIANQLISTGKATHSYVGISTETVDENLAAQYGLPVKSGALVRFVAPSGPAEQAGIKRSDIIVKIGDTRHRQRCRGVCCDPRAQGGGGRPLRSGPRRPDHHDRRDARLRRQPSVKLTIVAVGRLKERFWREAADEYLKRLKPYADVRVVEIADRDSGRNAARALAEEGADVLRAIPASSYVVALDSGGRQLSSEGLSADIDDLALHGSSHLVFVIGGSVGLSADVLGRADARLSLGLMTLPHNLARIVLLEQLYRAFRISRGEPYHKYALLCPASSRIGYPCRSHFDLIPGGLESP